MPRQKGADHAGSPSSRDEPQLGLIVEALAEVTRALRETNERLLQYAERAAGPPVAGPVPAGTAGGLGEVNVWEDDPVSEAMATPPPTPGATIAVHLAVNVNPKLQTVILDQQPAPAARYPT